MITRSFKPQSYKWAAFRIEISEKIFDPELFMGVKLFETVSGNLTVYAVRPGGNWAGIAVEWDGNYEVSKTSTAKAITALACSGHWSGGGTYRGYAFGLPGAVIFFSCKGEKKWLVFTDTGPEWHDTKPGVAPKEITV